MPRFYKLSVFVTLASLLLAAITPQTLCAAPEKKGEVTIPFTLTTQNNLVVRAVLNNKDTLKLMLHTAASDVTLTEEAVRKSKSLTFTGKSSVKSWGGKTDARFSKGNRVQIGPLRRGNIAIWEDKNSGTDTDGKFGLDFFDKRIVEIDFDHRCIILHSTLPRKVDKYECLPLENQNGDLLVEGSCMIEGKTYSHKFLLHSGYSGGVLLDDAFAAQTGIDGRIPITEESSLKDSFGNTIQVKKGLLPAFALGSKKLSSVPVGFFAGAIGAQKRSIMGCEVLMKFNLCFDIAHNALYIAPRRTGAPVPMSYPQQVDL